MTYSSGNTILATDYNTFVGTVNAVVGPSSSYRSGDGYGDSALATVSASATVNSTSWNNLIDAVKKAATHQGTTVNLPGSDLNTGDTIEALDGSTSGSGTLNLTQAVTDIDTNKGNVDTGEQTTIAGSTASTRGSAWGTGGTETITAQIRVQFSNQVHTDAFFNTGGEIHITFQHPNTGTSSAQDNAWRTIFNTAIGTLKLQKTSIARTGSSGTIAAFGYTSLTSSYQNIYTGTNIGGGAYGANDVNVKAKLDTTNHRVEFEIDLVDQSTAIAPSTADQVAAGTAVSFGFRKSSQYNPATPTVSQISGF